MNSRIELKKLKSSKSYYERNGNNNTQNIININNKQKNIQINNNNIKLLAFGKENINHIVEELYKKILNKGFKSVPTLVEQVHFNINIPENHNIYISNIRSKYVLVYDGNYWKLKERDDVLQQLMEEKTEILSDKFDELITILDQITIKKFRRFLNNRDENNVMLGIKNDLKLL